MFTLSLRNGYLRAFALSLKKNTHCKKNNSLTFAQVSDLNCTFASSEGRNPRFKNAFLAFTHTSKSPISKRRVETMRRSFCLYIPQVQPCCTPRGIYDSVGYLFLSSFSRGVWRYQMYDERDKSLRFSCIC